MATRTISALGGNWSSTATWAEGIVPTAADDVVARADGTSGNLTNDANGQLCRSLDFTHYTGTWAGTTSLNVGTTTKPASNVALLLVAGMHVTYSGTIVFQSTQAGNTVTTAGFTLGTMQFTNTGGWTLQDDLTLTGNLTATGGTFTAVGRTIQCNSFNGSTASAHTVTLTNSTIILTSANAGTLWNMTTTTLVVFSAAGSTISISAANANAKTFAGGGLTYGTLSYTTSGTGGLTISAANTFAALTVSGAARTVTLPAGATTTVTALTFGAQPGRLVTLVSSTPGLAATLSVPSGTVAVENMSIKDSTATGGATFTAVNSLDVSGNTGWTFSRKARGWGLAA